LWYLYHAAKGDHHEALHEAHLKYGPVIRVAPNELSFVEAQAWKDIYSRTKPEFEKHPSTTFSDDPAHPSILSAPTAQHVKLRRILSHAFSDKALYGQEAVINKYVMSLVDRLQNQGPESLDIVRWFNVRTD
jgi:cytochrome P450